MGGLWGVTGVRPLSRLEGNFSFEGTPCQVSCYLVAKLENVKPNIANPDGWR